MLHEPQVSAIINVSVYLSVQFAFHTFLLLQDTDLSKLTTGRANYSHLFVFGVRSKTTMQLSVLDRFVFQKQPVQGYGRTMPTNCTLPYL